MKNILKHKALIAAALVMLFASGCGSTSSNQSRITLKVWGTFETTDKMQPFINDFQQKHPNVQIQYTEKSVDSYESDLLNALASGNGPDIFAIGNAWLPKYSDKLVEAPSNYFNLRDYKSTFVDVAYNDFVKNGKIYAVPFSVDTLALYYNKDILGSAGIATPPKTWDELSKDVQKITIAGSNGAFQRSGITLGTTSNVNRAQDVLYLMMLQNGAQPYTSDFSQSTLDSSIQDSSGNTVYPAAAALDFYTSFSNPTSPNYSWNAKSNYSIDAFANGQAAFMYGYSYTRDDIMRKAPNLNYDVAPVPQPKIDQNLVNYANYWGFAVSKQSKSANAAWAFLANSTSKDNLTAYYKLHKLPSSRKDIINDQINDLDIGIFAAQSLTAKSFYKVDEAKVDSIILSAIDSVVLRGKQVEDAISSASQQISALNSKTQ